MAKKRPSKKSAAKRPAKKKPAMKKGGSKPPAAKKSATRKKATTKKKTAGKKKTAAGKRAGQESFSVKRSASRRGLGSDAGGQSGDLQGLPHRGSADSEGVEELLEEGNTLEAGVVAGVEEADEADEREVHTHEVPEDDVPEEYLDRDS